MTHKRDSMSNNLTKTGGLGGFCHFCSITDLFFLYCENKLLTKCCGFKKGTLTTKTPLQMASLSGKELNLALATDQRAIQYSCLNLPQYHFDP